jgi:ferrous iron transport protein B
MTLLIQADPSLSTQSEPALVVALAGQPNVGKSSAFNDLTRGAQYVSNWPGKTSEPKTGTCDAHGRLVQVVDLPGAYSLTANSTEERAVRDFLIHDRPDVVALIVNATALERNLYLLAELLALPVKVVLGLNMLDTAAQQGIRIEAQVLEAALGLPVVPLNAARSQGVHALIEAAICVAAQSEGYDPKRPEIRADHRSVLQDLQSLIAPYVPAPYPVDWMALKLLEGDRQITEFLQPHLGEQWPAVHAILMQHEDAILAIAGGRYEWIGRVMRAAITQPRAGQLTLTDRIDRVATHPLWGMLILLGILGVLFWLTYALGTPLQTWLDVHLVQAGSLWAQAQMQAAPPWLTGLVVNGMIAGVGTVLTLLPVLLIFFTALGILDDLGYMARAAYVMDRFMHLMGLHGKSFLPLFLGFGCNVPAVVGARSIESPKARLITILVTPLVPCTARLAVLATLAPIFFGARALYVSWGLVALNLVVLTGVGIVLHEGFLGGEHKAFIMELPLYQLPNLRTIGTSLWQRLVDFMKMAGTIILVVSVLLWALSTFPGGTIQTSFLGLIGQKLEPLGRSMGLDWQMLVALLTSFVRKENTIPTLAVLYGVGTQGAGLAEVLSSRLTQPAALAFLAVQMLFIPCMATLATIHQETHSWRWTALSVGLLLAVSLVMGITIYQGAAVVGWK